MRYDVFLTNVSDSVGAHLCHIYDVADARVRYVYENVSDSVDAHLCHVYDMADTGVRHVYEIVNGVIGGDNGLRTILRPTGKWEVILKCDTDAPHTVINSKLADEAELMVALVSPQTTVVVEIDARFGLAEALTNAFIAMKVLAEPSAMSIISTADLTHDVFTDCEDIVMALKTRKPETFAELYEQAAGEIMSRYRLRDGEMSLSLQNQKALLGEIAGLAEAFVELKAGMEPHAMSMIASGNLLRSVDLGDVSSQWAFSVDLLSGHVIVAPRVSTAVSLRSNLRGDNALIEADQMKRIVGRASAIAKVFTEIAEGAEQYKMALGGVALLMRDIEVVGEASCIRLDVDLTPLVVQIVQDMTAEELLALVERVTDTCLYIFADGAAFFGLGGSGEAVEQTVSSASSVQMAIRGRANETLCLLAPLMAWDENTLAELDEMGDGTLYDLDFLWGED